MRRNGKSGYTPGYTAAGPAARCSRPAGFVLMLRAPKPIKYQGFMR